MNVKAVVAAFNQEKALEGTFSVIVQLHRLIVYTAPSNTAIYFVILAATNSQANILSSVVGATLGNNLKKLDRSPGSAQMIHIGVRRTIQIITLAMVTPNDNQSLLLLTCLSNISRKEHKIGLTQHSVLYFKLS